MVDTKAPETKKQEPEVETEASGRRATAAEIAYEARSSAYAEGQDEIEAKRLEQAAPYEKLSKLIDEHALAEKGETPEPAARKK